MTVHVTPLPDEQDDGEVCIEAADYRDHELSADCWCRPLLEYVDADTGIAVYVHNRSHDE